MAVLPPNPYFADEARREVYEHMVLNLIKFYSMTVRLEAELTESYAMLVLQAGSALTGDRMTGFYAAVWEAAHFINAAAGPDVEEVSYENSEPTCAHEHCRVASEAEATLIEAAVRGDGDAVRGICKALVAEARRPDPDREGDPVDPEVLLFMLWSGSLRKFLNAFDPSAG